MEIADTVGSAMLYGCRNFTYKPPTITKKKQKEEIEEKLIIPVVEFEKKNTKVLENTGNFASGAHTHYISRSDMVCVCLCVRFSAQDLCAIWMHFVEWHSSNELANIQRVRINVKCTLYMVPGNCTQRIPLPISSLHLSSHNNLNYSRCHRERTKRNTRRPCRNTFFATKENANCLPFKIWTSTVADVELMMEHE